MNTNNVYNDYYKAIKRDESSQVLNNYQQNCTQTECNLNELITAQKYPEQIPTTSKSQTNHVQINIPTTLETGQPTVTITTTNGDYQHLRQQTPVKKSTIEVVMGSSSMGFLSSDRRPTIPTNAYSSQYYTRIVQQQNDAEEKYYYNQFERQYELCKTPAELNKSLRWIHWRMTMFVFYWIVWFIGLIMVIIIVAYLAKV